MAPSLNVDILLRDRRGRVVDARRGHNVFTNNGRNWLSRTVPFGGAAFPGADGNINLTDGTSGSNDTYCVLGKTYRPRYVGVGVGGQLQSISPPGPGGQIEIASVTSLERSTQVTASNWLRQLLPNNTLSDVEQYPDDYTTQLRAIFEYDDISFVAAEDVLGTVYGTAVPITEIGLYTSAASVTATPGSTGLIAYHQFSPLTKTPSVILEIRWRLEF